jgi:hypothetical protein
MTREDLARIPAETDVLRHVRYMKDREFDGITDHDLELAARWLRAAGHSANEGARRIERLLLDRQKEATT